MATVSSHTLNGVDGTHAAGIRLQLKRLSTGEILFDVKTSEEGRLHESVDISQAATDERYELLCHSGEYWDSNKGGNRNKQIMREVVLRFSMPEPDARYHMPLILNPNAYSCWWSIPE